MAYIVNALEGQNEKSEVDVCQHHGGQCTELLGHCFHPFIKQLFIEHTLYTRHCAACFSSEMRGMTCSAQHLGPGC